ncbi:MAG: diacylglycerol O-acyltransferase / wax synthase [Frankiaceae bacterium]|jgi:WS/DGAT/MGAT family acyltransferase|nr:diacylglycerol O-acyltransferase / wax synthase [Frankiaceae bacterium]
MTDRLSSLDVSFLYLETPTTAMHVGGVAIFDPPKATRPAGSAGFDYEALCDLVSERISLVQRYRQKVRWVPGHLANPVWVDDEEFDITYHVRRSALPRPGTLDQLRELVGRVQSRQLDRNRPLWEIYLVEGLEDGRFAIITKTHHAMVDGISAVDISTLILDVGTTPRQVPDDGWVPAREPSGLDLVVGAFADNLRRPTQVVDTVRAGVTDARATAQRALGAATGLVSAVRSSLRPAPASPLNATIGEQRRFGMAATELDDYKRIRKAHGGTVNDVVLATVAGALRVWLLTRGESVTPKTVVRAMVPVSVRSEDQSGALGNRVSALFVDLPVGEPSPVLRLHQVSYAMKGHKESGQAVAADAMVALTGFAPPTIHSAAARLASGFTRRLFNVVVTNVPGPQFPLYAAGAQMLECYPVVPLAKGQGVSIGLTSYNGGVYYGLNADRDTMPDVDVLAQCIEESLGELLETVT